MDSWCPVDNLETCKCKLSNFRTGSLIIDADIILPEDTQSHNVYLNASSTLIFNEETIEIDGQTGTFQSITIDDGMLTCHSTE